MELVSQLEFNDPFQHKYGDKRDRDKRDKKQRQKVRNGELSLPSEGRPVIY